MRSLGFCTVLVCGLWAACAAAQDNAVEEAAHRAAVLARLPSDVAQRAFGGKTTPAPGPRRRLSLTERDEMRATNVVAADGDDIDEATWTPQHRRMLEVFAREPGVARIFVNPTIKRALCREAGPDRDWLTKIRPWWGHNYHFHIRVSCPYGQAECRSQALLPPGDGCGKELAWWFTPEAHRPSGGPGKPLLMTDLPAACTRLAAAP